MPVMFNLMANCFTWIKKRREPWKKVTLLMVGLDNAGKTSTVADLTGDSTDGIVPTIGIQNSSFSLFRFHVTLFDLGGGARIRSIWKNYYADSHGIVFVVDASDEHRLEECKKILYETEMQPRVAGKPLLILGNKQDCEGALNENELHRQLELDSLTDRYKCTCKVFCCTAVLGKGNKVDKQIKKGFRWLLSEISKDFENISRRVERDCLEQKRRNDEERERRRERIRKNNEAREKAEREAAEKSKQQVEEESDDGVVVGKDKKKAKGKDSPAQETSPKKKKKQRETSPEPEEPEEPETTERKKTKKKKKKPKQEENEIATENTKVGEALPQTHSPIETPRDDAVRTPDEASSSLQPDLQDRVVSPTNENVTTPEDGEVKRKKKKKKRRKLNRTAPMEEENYQLPPLNAWDKPPASLNGFPGSSGMSPRRLEPLGPPRLQGSRGLISSSLPVDGEESNILPPLRGSTWTRSKPNSEEDVVT